MNRACRSYFLLLSLLLSGSVSAQINIVTVNNVAELKAALLAANSNGKDDIINLAVGTYTLTAVDNVTNGANGLPVIGSDANHSVTIHGHGSTLTRSGSTPFRILQCAPSSRVLIDGLTISNGLISFFGPGNAIGAGIFNDGGTLSVTTGAFNSNSVQGTPGGDGISNEPNGNNGDIATGGAIGAASGSTLTVTGCTFTNNSAVGGKGGNGFNGGGAGGNGAAAHGGAIGSGASSATIDSCTFTTNSAAGGNGGDTFGANADGIGATGTGGAIYGGGMVTRCTFTSSSVSAGHNGAPLNGFDPHAESFGGALDFVGTVTESTFTSNSAQHGGAMLVEAVLGSVSVALSSSLFQNNSASIDGGAIYVGYVSSFLLSYPGILSMSDCTSSGNSAPDGGTIYNSGKVDVTNCTIAGSNSTGGGAGALETNNNLAIATAISLVNSILKTGTTGTNVATNAITSRGHNISNDNAAGLLSATGDKPNTDPLFISDTPQDYGGPTKTIATGLFGSGPGINAGDDAYAPRRDQRGYFRTGQSDIGAYEYFGGLVGLATIARSGNDAIISAEVVYGHSYQLERKMNLSDSNWQPVGNEFTATDNDIEPAPTASNDLSLGRAFYHVRFTN